MSGKKRARLIESGRSIDGNEYEGKNDQNNFKRARKAFGGRA